MKPITCRNCHAPLKKKGNSWACQNCRSSYVDFAFLDHHFGSKIHDQILQESKSLIMVSRHSCAFCQQSLATHILFSSVQIESCFGCQIVWFDAGEIRKLQSVQTEAGLKLPSMEQFHSPTNHTTDNPLTALAKKNPFFAMVIMALLCFIVIKLLQFYFFRPYYYRPFYYRIFFR